MRGLRILAIWICLVTCVMGASHSTTAAEPAVPGPPHGVGSPKVAVAQSPPADAPTRPAPPADAPTPPSPAADAWAIPRPLPVPPALIGKDDRPWEETGPGARRKVYFNDHLTMVLFEVTSTAPPASTVPVHTHPHEQMTYILEGRARIQVGDEVRVVEAGAVYIVPPNVPHGMVPLSPRVVAMDVFTPCREDFRATPNAVKAFVHEWFSWFDLQADDTIFLAHLAPTDLRMEFPEATLTSHADFRRWYAGVRRDVASNTHQVGEVVVHRTGGADFTVVVPVVWEARKRDGSTVRLRLRQTWTLGVAMDGRMIIRRYQVETLKS